MSDPERPEMALGMTHMRALEPERALLEAFIDAALDHAQRRGAGVG